MKIAYRTYFALFIIYNSFVPLFILFRKCYLLKIQFNKISNKKNSCVVPGCFVINFILNNKIFDKEKKIKKYICIYTQICSQN